jgi:hypothetical protein
VKLESTAYDQDIPYKRHAEHFVISLNAEESDFFGAEGLNDIVQEFCTPLSDNYQLAYAVHEDKPHQLHAHIMLNNVSYTNGKRMNKNRIFLDEQIESLNHIISSKINYEDK